MSVREVREHARLLKRWRGGKATRAQILRCMELDRKGGIVPALQFMGHVKVLDAATGKPLLGDPSEPGHPDNPRSDYSNTRGEL